MQQENGTGSLYPKGNKIYRVNYDKNYKKGAATFYAGIKEFVEKIDIRNSQPYKCSNIDFAKIFDDNDLLLEKYTLGLAQINPDYVIMTDEPFICFICDMEKIPHISAIDFLFLQSLSLDKIIKYLNILSTYKFSNYFNVAIYKKIIDLIMQESKEKREEIFLNFQQWLYPKNSPQNHKQIVFNVYQQLAREDSNSTYLKYIQSIGQKYFAELYPEKYQEILERIKNTKMEVQYIPSRDNTITLQIKMIEKDNNKND